MNDVANILPSDNSKRYKIYEERSVANSAGSDENTNSLWVVLASATKPTYSISLKTKSNISKNYTFIAGMKDFRLRQS